MGSVARMGGDRTDMLAELERLRSRVSSGDVDGLMLIWDDGEGVDASVAGAWDLPLLVAHLYTLAGKNTALWMRGMEEAE
jgi:hypothetical protein